MEFLDVNEVLKDIREKIGEGRRLNLFKRPNLHTWLLYFPPGDVQRMHNHPSDRTYFVVTGRGIMRGPNQKKDLSPGKIVQIPAGEYYEGSNPYDEPMVLLGNSHKPTAEDVAMVGGMRSEIDKGTGKKIAYQHGGGRDTGKVVE